MDKATYIFEFCAGKGKSFKDYDPGTMEIIDTLNETSTEQLKEAFLCGKSALNSWKKTTRHERIDLLKNYQSMIQKNEHALSTLISLETGKPLWESKQEVQAMHAKIDISIEAFQERCPSKPFTKGEIHHEIYHQALGVICIIGPFNFPAHLPNGHIVPALLAGNTIVFKPSELTPKVGIKLMSLLEEAGLPKGVVSLVQGGKLVGQTLCTLPFNGYFFTGSYETGNKIKKNCPENALLALEMGGNNALIVSTVDSEKAAAYTMLQSAFISAGQRCTCARRIILIESEQTQSILEWFIHLAKNLRVGHYSDTPEPFMGPLANPQLKETIQEHLILLKRYNAEILLEPKFLDEPNGYLSPIIIDISKLSHFLPDYELFAPLTHIMRVKTLDEAISVSNQSNYGLSASILSTDKTEFEKAKESLHVGLLNWNLPTTGASSKLPFGGVGKSGNFRPSAYYASDYCSYPMSSMQRKTLHYPDVLPPGLTDGRPY
jgi:succinylglutamic semialdehyde dehydrogenase